MAEPCTLPFATQLQSGDDWFWKETLPGYPPDSFTLKYFFRGNAAGATLDLVAIPDPDNASGFLITVSGATTAAKPAGTYGWQKVVVDGAGKRTTLDSGTIELLPNLAGQTAPYDGRSHNKKMLDAIDARLEGRATRIETQYMVNGRELHLLSPKELEEWRGIYFNRVKRERLESGEVAPDANLIRAGFPLVGGGAGVWDK